VLRMVQALPYLLLEKYTRGRKVLEVITEV